MLPRWFRVVVALEIVGVIVFVVLGVRLVTQGVHAAGDALTWLRPSQHPSPSAPPTPDAGGGVPAASPRPASPPGVAGVGTLTPQLFAQLNRQTAAFAAREYALLRDLERLARDEILRLLSGLHVPDAP
jgi:hypothetical protein